MFKRYVCLLFAVSALMVLVGGTPAFAGVECSASCAQWWHVSFQSLPANLPPGGEGKIAILAVNYGDATPDRSSSLVLRDKLPAGLTAQSVSKTEFAKVVGSYGSAFCEIVAGEVICTVPTDIAELVYGPEAVPSFGPYGYVEIEIAVKVSGTAKSGEMNRASIAAGGAATASAVSPIVVSNAPVRFGVENYELRPENADGSADTQAGSHPFQLTSELALNQTSLPGKPPAAVKDLHFDLPPGLIGNPTPFPQCPLVKFLARPDAGGGPENACPDDTVVGVASVTISAKSYEQETPANTLNVVSVQWVGLLT